MKAATTSRFQSPISAASRQRSARRRSMSSSRRSMRVGVLLISISVERPSDDMSGSFSRMGAIRFGPGGLPDADGFDDAIGLLVARGYTACEIGFVNGF